MPPSPPSYSSVSVASTVSHTRHSSDGDSALFANEAFAFGTESGNFSIIFSRAPKTSSSFAFSLDLLVEDEEHSGLLATEIPMLSIALWT